MRQKSFWNEPKITKNAFPPTGTSFEGLSNEEIKTHEAIKKYDDFILTDAVIPSYDLRVKPQSGFRYDYYCEGDLSIPVVIISASKEVLFSLLMELIELIGKKAVDVILRTSRYGYQGYTSLLRECIDLCVLKSIFLDFEEFLLKDGCTRLIITGDKAPIELQFDDHKLLLIYNWPPVRKALLAILKKYGIEEKPYIKFICEAEHIHLSNDKLLEAFKQLAVRIGAEKDKELS